MNELLLLAGGQSIVGENTALLLQATQINASGIPVDIARPLRAIAKWDSPGGVSKTASKFGSVSFDCRLGGYLIPAGDKSDLVFPKNKDFTIEWWGYSTNRLNGSFLVNFSPPSGPSSLDFVSGGALRLRDSMNTATTVTAMPPSLSTWVHYAIVANGKTLSLFVDGAEVSRIDDREDWSAHSYDCVLLGRGGPGNSGGRSYQYMDQFRISRLARYEGNFPVPTSPFVLD